MPAYSRVCPACRRRVPHTIGLCRCGADLSDETLQPDGTVERPRRGPSSLAWSAVVAVAALGGIAIGALSFNRSDPAVDPAIPSAAVTSAHPADTAVSVETPIRQNPLAASPGSAPPAYSAPPADPAPPARPALPAPPAAPALPALEDVMTRVMPAVVLVDASGSRGSAFFVAPDTLLTNVHVVGRNSSVTLRRVTGETLPARVEATASEVDVAVLKISMPAPNQPTLQLASTASARVGQEVFAIGSALGLLQNTLTRGIVSGVRQVQHATLVQTDAAVNPGNSGGPLIDREGRVIGIITMQVAGREGLNFAVGIDHARAVLEGRRPSAAAQLATPASQDMRGLSPSLPSQTEQARTDGVRAYEYALAQLSRRADTLDNSWRQFRASCYEGRVAGSFDREWFAVFDGRAMQGAVAPGCGTWFADFRRQAAEVRDGVIASEELARQADVFPGIRRDTRRRYRLDYPGWDR